MKDMLQFAASVLSIESDAIAGIISHLDVGFERAVRLVYSCEGSLIVGGIGKSGYIGQKVSATFASTGTPSLFIHASEALHGDLGRAKAGDCAFLMSHSGETIDVLHFAKALKRLNIAIVAITGNTDSKLASMSDIVLSTGVTKEACPMNAAPTASTIAMLALGDALALTVCRLRGFSIKDFSERHPGGNLGSMLTPVRKLLRFIVGVNTSVSPDTDTLQCALIKAERFNRRSGAILTVDSDGKLSGLFTDGDIRRLLITRGSNVMNMVLRELIHRSPSSLLESELVRSAVEMVQTLRVDEIPIVNKEGEPIGILDVQDLLAVTAEHIMRS